MIIVDIFSLVQLEQENICTVEVKWTIKDELGTGAELMKRIFKSLRCHGCVRFKPSLLPQAMHNRT